MNRLGSCDSGVAAAAGINALSLAFDRPIVIEL